MPVEIGTQTNLLGTPAMNADRVRRDRDAAITTLQADTSGPLLDRLDAVAQPIGITEQVTAEPD